MSENGTFSFAKLFFLLALLALAVQLGFSLYNYVSLAQQSVSFPYPIDYGEGPLLDQTARLAQGETIYRNDFSQPPFTISNYPPAFLLLQVPFFKVFGPAFWYGRVISILGALITGLLIGLTLYTLTQDRLASLIGGLVFFAFPYVQFWSVLNRIDLLALVLSWAAIFVLIRWADTRWAVPAAGVFFILSIYTRQTYALAGPVTLFAWLLITHRTRKAFGLAALVGGGSLGLFLLINGLTQGGFFLNIVTANVNPFYYQNVNRVFIEYATNVMLLLTLVVIFFVAERAGEHTRYWLLILIYFILTGLGALTVGKDGSNINYLLELVAATAFGVGAAIAWMGRNPWLRAVVFIALAFQVNSMNGWTTEQYNGFVTEKVGARIQIDRLYQAVRETDGLVLADEFMGLLPLAGKPIYYQPFEYKMLAESGLWDDQAFIDSIRQKAFGLILWYDPYSWPAVISRWPEDIRNAVRANYEQIDTVDYTYIFRPKK